MKLFQHINVNVNVNSVIREGNKPGNYGDKIKSQSYHPAGISEICNFDSNRFGVARVEWVNEEVRSSGSH